MILKCLWFFQQNFRLPQITTRGFCNPDNGGYDGWMINLILWLSTWSNEVALVKKKTKLRTNAYRMNSLLLLLSDWAADVLGFRCSTVLSSLSETLTLVMLIYNNFLCLTLIIIVPPKGRLFLTSSEQFVVLMPEVRMKDRESNYT